MSGITEPSLSTSAVARAAGCSVQQVRDLERLGVIPPATRAPNGYRAFAPRHVLALRAYRDLAAAVGPVRARLTMRDLPALPLADATAAISTLHVGLVRERDDALAARRALRLIRAEAAGEAEPADEDAMTITELAAALGVRASTLRFWEGEGLIAPERVTPLAARRYPVAAIREARITAALRAAGYRIPEVRAAIAAIRELRDLDDPLAALGSRVDAIGRRMLALLRAGAALAELLAPSPVDPDPVVPVRNQGTDETREAPVAS